MTDLVSRAPGLALMEKVCTLRGTPDMRELPFGIVWLSADGMSWLRGVRGEQLMAKKLSRLGPEWTVLHSVPVGRGAADIDHLVAGPRGVFAINSKRLIDREVWVSGDRFLVDGHRREYLRNSEFEARRVEHVLRASNIPVPVMPILAISGAKSVRVKKPPTWGGRYIGVVEVSEVVRRMQRRTVGLSPSQVEHITTVLTTPGALAATRSQAQLEADVLAEYGVIDRGVTRLRWLVVALAVLASVAFALPAAWWLATTLGAR